MTNRNIPYGIKNANELRYGWVIMFLIISLEGNKRLLISLNDI